MYKINKKIPGVLPPPPKNEIDGKITDLSAKTIMELLDIRDRQLKLLNNKAFISKLADKGAKIEAFYEKTVNELKIKQEQENTCNLLRNLNLNKENVQNVEWEKGKLDYTDNRNMYLDSDDDSDPEDVLHVLSQRTAQDKKVKVIQQHKPLLTPEDLEEVGNIPHVKYIVNKTEQNSRPKSMGHYKPFKTTKSDVHNPKNEILRKKHKTWEVTAATPPPIVHGPAKVLSLEESLKLQQEYNQHLKEVEVKHAAEKLFARTGIKMSTIPINSFKLKEYRQVQSEDSDDTSDNEGSDKEIHDEEPERGGVVFTVMK